MGGHARHAGSEDRLLIETGLRRADLHQPVHPLGALERQLRPPLPTTTHAAAAPMRPTVQSLRRLLFKWSHDAHMTFSRRHSRVSLGQPC